MSNLIKSSHVISIEDLKRIEQLRLATKPRNISDSADDSEGISEVDVETQSMKDRILQDAQQVAEDMVTQAREEAEHIRSQAEQDADEWWQGRRQEDEQIAENARQQGYEEGFIQGSEQAERQMRERWEHTLQEAEAIVKQAYLAKESIIADAELFLVELSSRIAEKVIASKIEETPELTIQLISRALARRKEQGVITLCVAPSQFAFLQAAKDELALGIDSQAELQIIPDQTVGEGGCIIRTSFGSIDARIDTQLSAIRQELLRIAAHPAEERDSDVQTS
ncbi:flagellar assembly protein FliH [Cohnella sp. AR92]|uniref:flagellar assembly protein FliH n=1 Tax=Cohnella sp. AR92 TaxID=648716 RepID=UPI000F8E6C4C|nr:flagellar assembly protein FliH [Cohnella sp. AR92]RUS46375.1 flagellar assembly protein FliH [Cohnella sp. AR92]